MTLTDKAKALPEMPERATFDPYRSACERLRAEKALRETYFDGFDGTTDMDDYRAVLSACEVKP